ncbi:MerR family transcriptional regulator [Mycolicibacterium sp. 120266]|uniref:MerR family transcriptional regulator n=1 Tax=Mycolicibacterium sp. 120266 TaxID=3090601 RepID=UPI00299E5D58|nr:MerR family transcriptional regulator [Mycolicibacterium sp. 120266]MDX1871417.1 MerR family transcriptional regulator [Mycolicibacterium sp. 120266]
MLMTIGTLAERTGVPASAIRYWERHGLLPQPERQSGQRRYPPEAVERIILLRKCQYAGLTLADLAELQQDRPRRTAMITAKIAETHQRSLDLEYARQFLEHAIQCSHLDILACPKFRAQMTTWR